MAVQIILKNSSIEDKKPTPSQLTNGEISLNYSSAGAFLCCTDTDGNTQQVGGVKIDETAPDAPVKQSLWFKPSTLTLSVFDGDKWLPIAGGGGGGGGGDIIQIIGNDGIDADTIAGIVTLDVELAGGDDGLEFKSSKLSASLASATQLGSVKVGSNLEVAAGVINVPPASDVVLGVVKQGDGVEIATDGTISVDVPQTTTYRGSCNLNNPPTGQLNPDPAERGDSYINSANTAAVDAGWTGITGTAEIGDLVIFDGTIWDLIPLGSGTVPVTSVNTQIGDVVLTAADVGAATAAQGALADSALQPGDDISELNNNAGYITVAESSVTSVNTQTGDVVLDAADVGALAPGDNVSELANDAGYITLSEVPDQEPPVIISATAPLAADSEPGDLWFNSNNGRTYVYYEDADSSQWVDASPDGGGSGDDGLWLENAGYLSPKTGTNGVELGSGAITLDASDGSITATGAIKAGDLSDSSTTTRGVNLNLTSVRGQLFIQQTAASDPGGNLIRLFYGDVNTVNITGSGSSQFAGDMAIGVDGSFTPSTPAISLNADGEIKGPQLTDDFGNDFTSYKLWYSTSSGQQRGQINLVSAYRESVFSPATTSSFFLSSSVKPDGSEIKRFRVAREGSVYLYNNDGVYTTYLSSDGTAEFAGDIQSTSQNGGALAGFRNQIINGDFRIWQRGESWPGQTNDDYLGADRFLINRTSVSGEILTKSTTAPVGFDYSCTLPSASDGIQHGVEIEVGSAGCFSIGSTWTWSVWSDQDITGEVIFAFFRDVVGSGVNSIAAGTVPAFASTGETSNGFTRYSTTFTVSNSPNPTNVCLNLYIAGGANRSYAGWQLEPGPVATPFEHRPYGTELALCQRYYYKSESRLVYMRGMPNATTGVGDTFDRPTTMRVSPTIVVSDVLNFTVTGTTGERVIGTATVAGSTGTYTFTADAEL